MIGHREQGQSEDCSSRHIHEEETNERGGLPGLALLSLAAGVVTGLVGAAFRLSLDRADQVRDLLVAWAHQWGKCKVIQGWAEGTQLFWKPPCKSIKSSPTAGERIS